MPAAPPPPPPPTPADRVVAAAAAEAEGQQGHAGGGGGRPPAPAPAPLIAGLLRTRHCAPGSVFLVEGVDLAVPAPRGRGRRAVRLVLGDGALCIQALLRPGLHALADAGRVAAGCYVRLGRFELRRAGPGGPGAGDGDGGEMVYLVVEDLAVVGRDEGFPGRAPAERSDAGGGSGEAARLAGRGTAGGPAARKAEPAGRRGASRSPTREAASGGGRDGPDEEGAFEAMDVADDKAARRRRRAEAAAAAAHHEPSGPAHQHHRHGGGGAGLAWIADAADLVRTPVRLTPLRAIPHLPYRQNWAVNVLAVVASLSGVQPAALPPYAQRTARLADPSTAKRVLLTVFLDPEAFAPRVGGVVLLLGVKNHLFDGGSLKRYAGGRPAPGARWWLEDPRGLAWCDVEGLERWWAAGGGEPAG